MVPKHDGSVGSAAMIDTSLHEEAIGLTQDLIRVDSSNPPGNETPAALVLKNYLEANGLECELVARDPDRANLVARIPGNGTGNRTVQIDAIAQLSVIEE